VVFCPGTTLCASEFTGFVQPVYSVGNLKYND
jgi:hypothetical protein